MAIEFPVQPDATGSVTRRIRFKHLQPTRAAWICAAAACVLLAASEVLWLWHSWPVREVLESEQVTAGAPR